MVLRSLFVLCILANGFAANAQLKDTIFLVNNQALVGEFQRLRQGRVEFDVDNVGLVKIKYHKIKTVNAQSHLFRIQTSKGKVYFGYIMADSVSREVAIRFGTTTIRVPFDEMSDVRFLEGKKARSIDGFVSSGFSFTRSTDIGRLNLDGQIRIQGKLWESGLSASGVYTFTDSVFVRDREQLGAQVYHYLNTKWFLGAFLNYQRNVTLGLAYRFQEGFGFQYNLVDRINFKSNLRSGVVLNQEKNLDGEKFPVNVELPVTYGMEIYRFKKPEITFVVVQSFFVNLSQPGRYRWDGDIRLNWELIDDLALSIQFYHNYDSRPRVETARTLDYGTVIGLKYTF